MPDTNIKYIRGKFPSMEEIDNIPIGGRVLWIPDFRYRVKYGIGPVLYTKGEKGLVFQENAPQLLIIPSRG